MGIQQVEQPVADTKVSAPSLHQRNAKIAKIDSLTGLRFIAACLVYMFHTAHSADLPVVVRTFIASGLNGVPLFFILSGFVLCYNYYDVLSTRFASSLKSFFVARFARVYPLHFLIFLLYFASAPVLLQLQHIDLILAHITLTQAWSSHLYASYNGPAWSISVEAFLYLCFPLLVLLLFKRATKLWHLCLIGFVAFSATFALATWLSILLTSHTVSGLNSVTNSAFFWVYIFPVPRLGDFILGCVAARIFVLHMSKPVSPREQALGVTVLLLSIAAVVVVMVSSEPFLALYKLDTGFSLFFVFIIYTLARYVTPLSRFLSTKLLVLLGEASYAFYLLHIIFLEHSLAFPSISTRLSGDLYVAMEFLLVVVVSLGAHTYVEKPLRKIIRQAFASRASVPSSGPPVSTTVN